MNFYQSKLAFGALLISSIAYSNNIIVISGDRVEKSIDETITPMEVITSDQLESGTESVAETLNENSTLNVHQSGGLGKLGRVSIRGAQAGQTLVLVNGIKVNDPSTVNGSYDFSNLTSGDIEQIEVVKGPHSILYGAQATAGVINIITLDPSKDNYYRYNGAYSSNNTFTNSAAAHFKMKKHQIKLFGYTQKSEGDSVANAKTNTNADKDGHRQDKLSLALKNVIGHFDINSYFEYQNINTELDGTDNSGVPTDDVNAYSTSENTVFGTRVSYNKYDHIYIPELSVSFFKVDRDSYNLSSTDYNSLNNAKTINIDFLHKFERENYNIIAGHSFIEDKTIISDGDEKRQKSAGHFFDINGKYQSILASLGTRLEHHQNYKDQMTYKGALGFEKGKLRSILSVASGFRAPTNFQLFATTYGNPNLEPEESLTYDLTTRYKLNKQEHEVSIFQTVYRNQIGFSSTYVNNKATEIKGIEGNHQFEFSSKLNTNFKWTVLSAKDRTTHGPLLLAPRTKANLKINYLPTEKLKLSLSALYYDRKIDYNGVNLPSYSLINTSAKYSFKKDSYIIARINNLLNKEVEVKNGFTPTTLGYYLGVQWSI